MSARTPLPRDLTSYDWLKTLAVLLMIVDHVGYFFFPYNLWPRVAGRLCVPIWFFLIGYAHTRALEPRLWIGGFFLEAGRFLAGIPVFPIPVLFTFMAIRHFMDRLMGYALRYRQFWQVNVFLFLMAAPSFHITEYGTVGLLFAVFGWLLRNQQAGNPLVTKDMVYAQLAVSTISFVFWETWTFSFSQPQTIALSIGVMAIMGLLLFFRPRTYPSWNAPLLKPARVFLQFCGRWTLEIYVLHVLIFSAIAIHIYPLIFPAFTLRWMSG